MVRNADGGSAVCQEVAYYAYEGVWEGELQQFHLEAVSPDLIKALETSLSVTVSIFFGRMAWLEMVSWKVARAV